jgi:acetyl/propionyl-CoA carboxylase alpha subunit
VRIDSGVREGDAISPFYDPMIAKLIVWGADRKQALARMAQALAQYQIVGLATNIAFLKRLVEGQAFATADLDTGLIERNHDSLFPPRSQHQPARWHWPPSRCWPRIARRRAGRQRRRSVGPDHRLAHEPVLRPQARLRRRAHGLRHLRHLSR